MTATDRAGFSIRAAGPEDLSALLDLYRELQPDDPAMDEQLARNRFDEMLAHPGMAVFMAFSGDRAVSTITLVLIPNLTRGGAPYALIENVVTHAAHRRRGYAGALIRHGIDHAWAEGCYKVMLLSGSKNPATLDFYRNCGFCRTRPASRSAARTDCKACSILRHFTPSTLALDRQFKVFCVGQSLGGTADQSAAV